MVRSNGAFGFSASVIRIAETEAGCQTLRVKYESVPQTFYVYNILDGAIAYLFVAVANGLIYPRLFGDQQAT